MTADIQSTRPLGVASLFHGKSVDETLRTLPVLYSLCGTAQAYSAAQACEQALGLVASPATTLARSLLVLAETAREHLWRILFDWPGFIGERPAEAGMAQVAALLPSFRTALFSARDPFLPLTEPVIQANAVAAVIDDLAYQLETRVFGCTPESWLSREDSASLDRWAEAGTTLAARLIYHVSDRGWQGAGTVETAFLPPLDTGQLRHRFNDDSAAFIARPDWEDRCRETTPLARQRHHFLVQSLIHRFGPGLLARLVARLVELARIPAQLRSGAVQLQRGADTAAVRREPTGYGIGMGQVEAARGRLIHYVETEGSTVRRYHILAPTEWNFHRAGVVAQGLRTLPATDQDGLRQQAALWINAIDPCVGYALRIH